jgi:hypothetical protein
VEDVVRIARMDLGQVSMVASIMRVCDLSADL